MFNRPLSNIRMSVFNLRGRRFGEDASADQRIAYLLNEKKVFPIASWP